MCAAVLLAVRVGRKVDQTEINAKYARWLIRRGIGFGLRDVQIPDVRPSEEFRPANLPGRIVQRAPLEVAQDKLPNHPTCERIQTHAVKAHQAIGASVVADAAIVSKRRTVRLLVLSGTAHGFCGLVSGAARQLRAKSKLSACATIDKVM